MSSCEVTELGFKFDRQWMLVDNSNRFLSQRELPQMSLFACELGKDSVIVKFKEHTTEVPFNNYTDVSSEVSIWDHQVQANEVSTRLSAWFSEHLEHNCKLVTVGKNYNRIKAFSIPPFKSKVSFADGYPVMILGTASLELLNSKLTDPVGFDRFRPNIVVQTNRAHEEDSWEYVQTGTARLKIIKPCARCIITTIDQSNGTKGKEPLRTLSTYRKESNNVLFGANAIMHEYGVINNTDKITLL